MPSILIILIISKQINHCFQLTKITIKLGECFLFYNSSFLLDNAYEIPQENLLYENKQTSGSKNTKYRFIILP